MLERLQDLSRLCGQRFDPASSRLLNSEGRLAIHDQGHGQSYRKAKKNDKRELRRTTVAGACHLHVLRWSALRKRPAKKDCR